MTNELTADHCHVILDALSAYRHAVLDLNDRPWETYETDPRFDAKASRDGWLRLFYAACDITEAIVSSAGGQVEPPNDAELATLDASDERIGS